MIIKNRKLKENNLCTCCGINPKVEGFRYLCLQCWKENTGVVGDDLYRVLAPQGDDDWIE